MATEKVAKDWPSLRILQKNRGKLRDILGIYGLLVALIVVMGILSPRSLSAKHLLDIFRQAAPLGIVTIGQTVILLTAGIDLSVGAVLTLTNVVAASLMAAGNSAILSAVAVSLTVAAAVGFFNGFLVAKARIPPFIVTLAMASVIQGGYLAYTKGSPTGSIAPGFRAISEGWIGGFFPWAGVIWLVVWAVVAVLLYLTIAGRKIYAVGGNLLAARLSGIRTDRTIILSYLISSLSAAVSGLLLSAYIGVASMSVGADYTLNSIAAAVIGGTTFSGGEGGLAGGFAGALIMVFLESILTMLNIGEPGKLVSQGLIIAVMVALYQRRNNRV